MATMRTLRPGLLVSLSARITGGVNYQRKDLDAKEVETAIPGVTAAVTKWETTKVIEDPQEFERAQEARNKARRTIASVCAASDFGLLCPSSKEFDLARAIEEAKRIATEHNATARRSFVSIYVISGRIAADDAEAARAIASEVRGLIDEMRQGIDAADPKAIRDAANKAKSLGAMLTDDANAKVTTAIEEARKAAREIVKRVEKGGEMAATVIAEMDRRALDAARGAFLDLDEGRAVETAKPEAAALDFEPEPTDEFRATCAHPWRKADGTCGECGAAMPQAPKAKAADVTIEF